MPPAHLPELKNLELLTQSDYAKVFELLHTGIAVMSDKGRFLYCNRAFLEMFNLPKDIHGKHVLDFFVTGEAGVMTTIRTRKPTFCTSLTTDNEQGISFRYPLLDDKGKLHGVIIESISPSIGKEKIARLTETLKELEEKSKYIERQNLRKPGQLHTFDSLLGESGNLRHLKQLGARFAKSGEPILVLGESGTGKELVAQALHSASRRSGGPFVTVNCAALPHELMEAELFGYEGGAFTGARSGGSKGKFELANKGTIFLDEIGELPLTMQAKLLRVLESGEIQKLAYKGQLHSDFRLIAATNRDLQQCVRAGTFRQDLYHRLNILELAIPPLRDRLDDIPILCNYFIEQHAGQRNAKSIQISPELYRVLRKSSWPGNIRELKNILTYALFNLEENERILAPKHLPRRFLESIPDYKDYKAQKEPVNPKIMDKPPRRGTKNTNESTGDEAQKNLRQRMTDAKNEAESRIIQDAMRNARYNKSEAAQLLGISRNKLYRKLKQLGLLGEHGQYRDENWQ